MNREPFKLAEEAALWLVRLSEQPSPDQRREFFEWARQSPRHMEEFMFAKAVSAQLNGMDPGRKIEIDRAALAALKDGTVAGLPGRGLAVRRQPTWLTGLAAALLALAVGALSLHVASHPARSYATAIGDQQSIKLPDGSLMQLNTRSKADVRFSKQARSVRLLEGEALFTVTHDPARPFRVTAGNATIQALGTEFNVYRRADATRVSVIEGAVQVSAQTQSLRLAAGAEAEITPQKVIPTAKPDVQRALAWRARRLVFHADRLDEVVREFNRYNRIPIRLEGPEIAGRRISGMFDADDPRPLIDFLAHNADFSITQTSDAIAVRRR